MRTALRCYRAERRRICKWAKNSGASTSRSGPVVPEARRRPLSRARRTALAHCPVLGHRTFNREEAQVVVGDDQVEWLGRRVSDMRHPTLPDRMWRVSAGIPDAICYQE